MAVERIGVHESTAIDFPFAVLADELADVPPEIVPIRDDPGAGADPATCDAFVTFTHQPRLLEADPAWIHTTLAGVEEFPLAEYEHRGVVLTNSTGFHGDSVGDTTLGLMLTLARRLHEFVANQQTHTWAFPDWDAAFTLPGERVCIVGLGTVGGGVAKRCAALDMDIVGVQRSDDDVAAVDEQYHPDDLHDAIADARFVVLGVPLTEETRHLLGAAEFERMREDAYVVNVARGEVVDEAALIAALREGEVAGAALDVFETEPLPEDSPLWDFEDVIISPHKASATNRYHLDIADLVKENVRRFRSGDELRNRVA